MIVKSLNKGVKKMVCGDNYSAVIDTHHKLFVCGNQERGKLGLGIAFTRGILFSFKEVILKGLKHKKG